MKTGRILQRRIAAFLTFVLFAQNVLLAHTTEVNIWNDRRQSLASKRESLSLPENTGPFNSANNPTLNQLMPLEIQSAVGPYLNFHEARAAQASTAKTVYLIQDIHLNHEAQNNIANAIAALAAQGQKFTIGAEGADNADINFAPFRRVGDVDLRRRTAQDFLKANILSGVEFAAIAYPSNLSFSVVGIEDQAEYDRDVQSLKDAYRLKQTASRELEKLNGRLQKLKEQNFTPPLRSFDKKLFAYRAGELPLSEYALYLNSLYPLRSPQASLFLELTRLEKAIDFAQVERERQKMVTDGSSADIQRYPQLNRYIEYMLKSRNINATLLYREIQQAETRAQDRLTATAMQKEIMHRAREAYLLSKLFEHTLTQEEWRSLAHATFVNDKNSLWSVFANFYRVAEKRNVTMARKMMSALDHQHANVGVLVAGGFHSDAVKNLLLENGVSVVLLSPRLTALPEKSLSTIDLLAEDRRPLDQLFAGERLFIPLPLETAGPRAPALAEALEKHAGELGDGHRPASWYGHAQFSDMAKNIFKVGQSADEGKIGTFIKPLAELKQILRPFHDRPEMAREVNSTNIPLVERTAHYVLKTLDLAFLHVSGVVQLAKSANARFWREMGEALRLILIVAPEFVFQQAGMIGVETPENLNEAVQRAKVYFAQAMVLRDTEIHAHFYRPGDTANSHPLKAVFATRVNNHIHIWVTEAGFADVLKGIKDPLEIEMQLFRMVVFEVGRAVQDYRFDKDVRTLLTDEILYKGRTYPDIVENLINAIKTHQRWFIKDAVDRVNNADNFHSSRRGETNWQTLLGLVVVAAVGIVTFVYLDFIYAYLPILAIVVALIFVLSIAAILLLGGPSMLREKTRAVRVARPEDDALLNSIAERLSWYATKMIAHANAEKRSIKVGGHPAATASSLHMMMALNYFALRGQDHVADKPHAAPTRYAISYTLGKLNEEIMYRLRETSVDQPHPGLYEFLRSLKDRHERRAIIQQLKFIRNTLPAGAKEFRNPGLHSYPSLKNPDGTTIPTGSVGFGGAAGIALAILQKWQRNHGYVVPDSIFYAYVGDGEVGEGNYPEMLELAVKYKLGNVIHLIDCNTLSLDGIMSRVDIRQMKGRFVGWKIIELRWGRKIEKVFSRKYGELLRRFLERLSPRDYQHLIMYNGAEIRHWIIERIGSNSKNVEKLLRVYNDTQLKELIMDLGGHDMVKLTAALEEAKKSQNQPVAIIAYTIKGWGLPSVIGHDGNHKTQLSKQDLRELETQRGVSEDRPFAPFTEGSDEAKFLETVRVRLEKETADYQALLRENRARYKIDLAHWPERLVIPALGNKGVVPTQVAMASLYGRLQKLSQTPLAEITDETDRALKPVADRFFAVFPDVGLTTFPMLMKDVWGEKEDEIIPVRPGAEEEVAPPHLQGRHMTVGIKEMSAATIALAFGKSNFFNGIQMFSSFVSYAMFLFRRAKDFIFLGQYFDSRFFVIGTPRGASLGSEGSQHQAHDDMVSARETPNMVGWEPAYPEELEFIVADEIRRMFTGDNKGRTVPYLGLSTRGVDRESLWENLSAQARYRGMSRDEIRALWKNDVLSGGYKLLDLSEEPGYDPDANVINIAVSGTMVTEALMASKALRMGGIFANVVVVTSADLLFGKLAPKGSPHLQTLIPSSERLFTPLITLCDSSPLYLSDLGTALELNAGTAALGITRNGMTTQFPEKIYALHGISAQDVLWHAHDLIRKRDTSKGHTPGSAERVVSWIGTPASWFGNDPVNIILYALNTRYAQDVDGMFSGLLKLLPDSKDKENFEKYIRLAFPLITSEIICWALNLNGESKAAPLLMQAKAAIARATHKRAIDVVYKYEFHFYNDNSPLADKLAFAVRDGTTVHIHVSKRAFEKIYSDIEEIYGRDATGEDMLAGAISFIFYEILRGFQKPKFDENVRALLKERLLVRQESHADIIRISAQIVKEHPGYFEESAQGLFVEKTSKVNKKYWGKRKGVIPADLSLAVLGLTGLSIAGVFAAGFNFVSHTALLCGVFIVMAIVSVVVGVVAFVGGTSRSRRSTFKRIDTLFPNPNNRINVNYDALLTDARFSEGLQLPLVDLGDHDTESMTLALELAARQPEGSRVIGVLSTKKAYTQWLENNPGVRANISKSGARFYFATSAIDSAAQDLTVPVENILRTMKQDGLTPQGLSLLSYRHWDIDVSALIRQVGIVGTLLLRSVLIAPVKKANDGQGVESGALQYTFSITFA